MNFILTKNSLLLLVLLFFSCASKENSFQKLNTFLEESNINFQKDHQLDWIILIDETGCIACNKKFANAIVPFINAPNGLILISASGTSIDISPYLSDTTQNVFGVSKMAMNELNLLNGSGVIFLTNKIDTVIKINSKDFNTQLKYILNEIQ